MILSLYFSNSYMPDAAAMSAFEYGTIAKLLPTSVVTGSFPSKSRKLVPAIFDCAVQLTGTLVVFVRSLDDATGVLREYMGRRPITRDLILRRLSSASTNQETGEAARTFRWWAEQEGLLALT